MLMTYDASVEVMNKRKLFSAEHTVDDSALQTQQKTKVRPVLQICTLNFHSQCWIGSFFMAGWLLERGRLAIVI